MSDANVMAGDEEGMSCGVALTIGSQRVRETLVEGFEERIGSKTGGSEGRGEDEVSG
jgi:hypothetical protein